MAFFAAPAIPWILGGAATAARAAAPFLLSALGRTAAQTTARTVAPTVIRAVSTPVARSVTPTVVRSTTPSFIRASAPTIASRTAAPTALRVSAPSTVRSTFPTVARSSMARTVAPATARPTIGLNIPPAVGPTSAFPRGLSMPIGSRPAAGFPGYGQVGATSALRTAPSATRVGTPLTSAESSQLAGAFSRAAGASKAAPSAGTASEAAATAASTSTRGPLARAIDIATGGGNWKTQLAVGAGTAGLEYLENETDLVPDQLMVPITALGSIAGVRGGLNIAKNAKGLPGLLTGSALALGSLGGGAYLLADRLNIGPFSQAEEETPETPEAVAPVLEQRSMPQPAVAPGSPEDEAMTQLEAIDAAFQAAVDEVMANYGSVEEALLALESGDPMLAQALASLDAQYQQAQTAVAAQYSAAVGDIAGYQQQVDQLMQEAAEAQMADYAAAAGGLENIDVGLDPATAAMAADAGVSDTALGGGAITGAALSRGLAGAASAQNAADRMRVGGELAGQVAAGRLEGAAQQAALTNQYLGQRYQTEREAMIAEAERQQAIDDAILQNKIRMGEALSSIELQRAQQLAALSPQDYAAATGQQRTMQTPAWFNAAIPGNISDRVEGFVVNIPDVGPDTADVGIINSALDQLTAASSLARDLYNQGDRARALATLAEFYGQLDDELVWFENLGVPTSAPEAYAQLFGESPV